MAKYNWSKLKTKYITGGYKSLKDFAEKEGIPYGLLRTNAAGWVKEKHTKTIQKQDKITEVILGKQIEAEAIINQKHYGLWEAFVEKLSHKVNGKGLNPKGLKALADVLEKAQKGQRLAAGLKNENDNSKDNGGEEPITINFNFEDTGKNG